MTDSPTIALCFPTCNNLPILRSTLIHNMRWADQICVLDMGSTDGTKEFLEAVLRLQDRYSRCDSNFIPNDGFSAARAGISALAGTDWIWHGGSNCCLDWTCQQELRTALANAKRDVVAHQTLHVDATDDCIEVAVKKSGLRSEWHRQIHRRGVGIEMKGYIHEELYRGDQNCHSEAEAHMEIRQYHFEGRGDDHLRRTRAAWMLRRAMNEPELRKWTNAFWFDRWVPEHQDEIHAMAEEYQRGGVGR